MPEKIPSWINELCSIFPCMIQRVQGNGFEINWGKVAQSLVVVAIIASSTSFVTVKVLESQFANLKSDMKEDILEIKKDIKEMESIDKQTNKIIDEIAKNVTGIETKQSEFTTKQTEFNTRLGKLEDK